VVILTNTAEGGTSRVYIGPLGTDPDSDSWTDLGYIDGPTSFEVEAGHEYRLDACVNFAPASITLRYRSVRLDPRVYRLLFGRRHPRIHQLRSDYRHKTKGRR
jgi:hypothetical protein